MPACRETGFRALRRAILRDGESIVKIKYDAPRRSRLSYHGGTLRAGARNPLNTALSAAA
jgi:hypothetical protein